VRALGIYGAILWALTLLSGVALKLLLTLACY